MKIYLIGTNTISFANDIDFSDLKAFGELRLFPCLSADEVIESCADADILLVNKPVRARHRRPAPFEIYRFIFHGLQ